MSFSAHIDDERKDILILGKGRTRGLEHTLTVEKMYSANVTVNKKKLCLNLHYNGANSYFLSMVQKFTNSKQKILRLWQLHYAQETFSLGNVYDFSVDYDATDVDDMLDIDKYLMKKK